MSELVIRTAKMVTHRDALEVKSLYIISISSSKTKLRMELQIPLEQQQANR